MSARIVLPVLPELIPHNEWLQTLDDAPTITRCVDCGTDTFEAEPREGLCLGCHWLYTAYAAECGMGRWRR